MKKHFFTFFCLINFLLTSCSPTISIHQTIFTDKKWNSEISLLKKDSIEFVASIGLSDWIIHNSIKKGTKEYDSVMRNKKEDCDLFVQIYLSNLTPIVIKNFDIKILKITESKDSLIFNHYCKTKGKFDIDCYSTKQELIDSIGNKPIPKDSNSKLLFRLETKAPSVFDEKKIYALINIDFIYKGKMLNINYADTLKGKEEVIMGYDPL